MSDNYVINPVIDTILRAANRPELICIKSFIDQLLQERQFNDYLTSRGIEKGSSRTLEITIDELDISVVLYNILKAAKIQTLGDVQQYGIADLRKLRGLGRARIEELIEEFRSRGLILT